MVTPDPPPRPQPLRDVAQEVSLVVGIVGGVISSLAGVGVLSAAQGVAVSNLLGLIPGLITAIFTAIASFRTANQGEPLVTPNSDPRDSDGNLLVPAIIGRHEKNP